MLGMRRKLKARLGDTLFTLPARPAPGNPETLAELVGVTDANVNIWGSALKNF
jgi:hypothetical protein